MASEYNTYRSLRILDDVDTASDVCKEDDACYRQVVQNALDSRSGLMSDAQVEALYDRYHPRRASLLPVMNPWHNLREICKQAILLEDHLNQPEKRCTDCIRKHFLTIEALYEEAVSLNPDPVALGLLEGKPDYIRGLMSRWGQGEDERKIAADLRALRKPLTAECWDVGLVRLAATCPHKLAARYLEAFDTATSHALIKWLSQQTNRLGVSSPSPIRVAERHLKAWSRVGGTHAK